MAKGLFAKGHQIQVLVFYGGGELEEELRKYHIPVQSLEKTGRWDVITFLYKLYRVVRTSKSEILHSYLVTANTITALLKFFLPGVHIVWGVRSSNMNLENYDWVARWSYRIERWLSGFADLIICNSNAGRDYAVGHGFPAKKLVVIQNGIDTERFKPDPVARARGRLALQAKEHEILIGIVARFDPIKGHPTFLQAAAEYSHTCSDVRFICIGNGSLTYRRELEQLSSSLGLADKVSWVNGQKDMPIIYNALDLVTSTSYGEGFPNVIAEAMACGLPCVVTDVGDSRQIIEGTGVVIPAHDVNALVRAWQGVNWNNRQDLSNLARARICEKFSHNALIKKTEDVLWETLTS